MSGRWRLLLVLAGVVVAVLLFLVLRGNGDKDSAQPSPPTMRTDRQPPPPPLELSPLIVLIDAESDVIERATVGRGEQVVLAVTGPPGEEIHLHGYDITRKIGSRGRVSIAFRATVPGRFEVELHGSHEQIGDITVR